METEIEGDDILKMMAELDEILTRDNKGKVVLSQGTRPAWVVDLLKHAHSYEAPDQIKMECIKEVASTFADWRAEHLAETGRVTTDLYGMLVSSAAQGFMKDNQEPNSFKKWLMWGGGENWPHISLAMQETLVPSFEELIATAMEIQCREIGEEMVAFIMDGPQAEDEPESVKPESPASAALGIRECPHCLRDINSEQWQSCKNAHCPGSFSALEHSKK